MNRLDHALGFAASIRAAREAMEARQRLTRLTIEQAREQHTAKQTRQRVPSTRPRCVAVAPVQPQPTPRPPRRTRRTRRPGPAVGPPCRRCGHPKPNRPRGLCWMCFYTPGVREQFPSLSKFGRRGIADTPAGFRLPAMPTTAVPGTPEKLAVMEARAESRVALHHPADARYPGDPRPREWMRAA